MVEVQSCHFLFMDKASTFPRECYLPLLQPNMYACNFLTYSYSTTNFTFLYLLYLLHLLPTASSSSCLQQKKSKFFGYPNNPIWQFSVSFPSRLPVTIIMEMLYNNRRPAIKYMAPTNEDALQDTDDEAVQE